MISLQGGSPGKCKRFYSTCTSLKANMSKYLIKHFEININYVLYYMQQ